MSIIRNKSNLKLTRGWGCSGPDRKTRCISIHKIKLLKNNSQKTGFHIQNNNEITYALSRIQQRAIDKDPDSREDPIPAAETSLLSFSSPVTNSSNLCNKWEQRPGILPFSEIGFAATEEESKIKWQELHPVAITTTWLSWLRRRVEFRNARTCKYLSSSEYINVLIFRRIEVWNKIEKTI